VFDQRRRPSRSASNIRFGGARTTGHVAWTGDFLTPQRNEPITFHQVIDVRRDWTYKGDVQRTTSVIRDPLAILASLLVPPAACAVIVPWRDSFPNTDAALILVAAIVAVAALGSRVAGIVAAVSSGVSFDFFLTKPYEHFSITSRTDVGTTLLLLVVGIAVTELAVWGRRQQRQAGQQSGYLAGLHAASEAMASGGSPTQVVRQVAQELTRVLDLQTCHFDFGSGFGQPKLNHDGTLTWAAAGWDIDTQGLPQNNETELLVSSGSGYKGRFLMTPVPGARPTLTQRLVAVSLADQVGAALGEYDPSQN
jgi:K+-sensing histidine kinase KdpD